MIYLKNAPAYLKQMHERGGGGQARKLLGLLLTRNEMDTVWIRLSRKINAEQQWRRLWDEIIEAIKLANPKRKPKRVEDEIADLEWIAAKSVELAKVIRVEPRSVGYKGFFDYPCYQFCPDDVMEINGVPQWSSVPPSERYITASKVMREWPTMAELLDELARVALRQAGEVKHKRIVKKDKERWSETMFSRALYSHLAQYGWEKQDCIFANIATIANLTIKMKLLKTNEEGSITAKFVGKAVK
jgi:hypothetical protein